MTTTCPYCGSPFERGNQPRRIYCSRLCATKTYSERRGEDLSKARATARTTPRVCPTCNAKFFPATPPAWARQIYCCDAHRPRKRGASAPTEMTFMGKPVRTLKKLAENDLATRRICRALAREQRAAIEGLPANLAPVVRDALVQIAVRLELAGAPPTIDKPTNKKATT